MGSVTLPTPVLLAGGGLCLVAGYLGASVVAPDTAARTTARVVSFETRTSRLCLQGDAAQDQQGADSSGVLCGTWDRGDQTRAPREGDVFRFVSVAHPKKKVVIYGDVAG